MRISSGLSRLAMLAGISAAKPVPHFHHEGEAVAGDLDRIASALAKYIDCESR